MTMDNKKVHVKAYTKDDGTKVKEHYRGLPEGLSDEDRAVYESIRALNKNDLKVDEMYLNEMKSLNDARVKAKQAAENSVNAINKLIKYAAYSKSTGKWESAKNALKELEQVHAQQHAQHKALLMKLVNAKNQNEYARLYRMYMNQNALLKRKDYNLRVIKRAIESESYDTIIEEAQKYRTTYKEVGATYRNLTKPYRTILHNNPDVQQSSIDLLMRGLGNAHLAYDTNALWQMASSDFQKSGEYIKQNGKVVSSISQLPERLQRVVRPKIKQQFKEKDLTGVIFHTESSLAKAIERSKEFKTYIKNNKARLLRKEKINGSLSFSRLSNVGLALGKTDIIDLHIDSNGNLTAQMVDTYDFNRDDSFFGVEWARNQQERHRLRGFYTITEISIPVERWLKFIFD